jgi:hypothetical protein
VKATRDVLGLFRGAARTLAGFSSVQPFAPLASLLSAAGIGLGRDVVVVYRLGAGIVVDAGLAGFGSRLARDRAARALLDAIRRRLS